MLWALSSHHVWCCGHWCCAAFGVAVAFVMPHIMSQALLLHRTWCCRCWCHAAFGVAVAFVTPCMVLWALLLCRLQCCGCFRHAERSVVGAVVRLCGVMVVVTMPCAVSHCRRACVVLRLWSQWLCCVLLRCGHGYGGCCCAAWCRSCSHRCHIAMATSWPHVITICAKEKVSRKKKKKKMYISRW